MSFGVAKRVLNYFREEKSVINNHLNDLSKTEHEILELLAQGLLYKEIADKDVTIDTIKNTLETFTENYMLTIKLKLLIY
jgi:DNA-binding NarL/FixJ family response regulator